MAPEIQEQGAFISTRRPVVQREDDFLYSREKWHRGRNSRMNDNPLTPEFKESVNTEARTKARIKDDVRGGEFENPA